MSAKTTALICLSFTILLVSYLLYSLKKIRLKQRETTFGTLMPGNRFAACSGNDYQPYILAEDGQGMYIAVNLRTGEMVEMDDCQAVTVFEREE